MSVNFRDIAKESKVSISTVSRVLNNHPNITEQTKKKVMDVVKKLNYDPSKNIPFINRIKTRNIGIFFPNFNITENPFYSRALGPLKNMIGSHGYSSLLYYQGEFEKLMQDEAYKGKGTLQCEGLVFICPSPSCEPYYKTIQAWQIPAAVVRRRPSCRGIATVHDDDYRGAGLALEHLFGLGHRRIGCIGITSGKNNFEGERTRAYYDFMQTHSLSANEKWIFTRENYFDSTSSQTWEECAGWLTELMRSAERPTAFFVSNDQPAVDTVKALLAAGVRVPEDVSLVGYSDDITARNCIPALTTVRVPLEEMSRLACKYVFDCLEGFRADKAEMHVDNTLVVRESTRLAV